MKNIEQLEIEITQLTSNIETNYPELYRHLDETAVFVPDLQGITAEQLTEYYERLKAQLRHYLESGRVK